LPSSAAAAATQTQKLRWSSMFRDTMVLQQAPKQAKVWGFAAPGATVSVTLDGVALGAAATAASDGRWEALLPAVAGALGTEHNVTAASAGQATIVLRRLLFGEVWICSGQSNMVRPVNWANASALEIKHAAEYDDKIRLFMVCNDSAPHCHAGSGAPLADFRFVDTQWLAPTSPNGQQLPAVAKFAASCWYFGRDLWDGWSVAQKVPLWLVLSSVGGTRDQCWSSPAALAACPSTGQNCTAKHGGNSGLWNSLIHPMLGLSFRGAVWCAWPKPCCCCCFSLYLAVHVASALADMTARVVCCGADQGEANSVDPLDCECDDGCPLSVCLEPRCRALGVSVCMADTEVHGARCMWRGQTTVPSPP
jgi:sialate O-acetylesterase